MFCGYRYDAGPNSFKGVHYVINYAKVKNREANYSRAIAVPMEEFCVEEKDPVLPLKQAADAALATFTDAALADITPLDVPFPNFSVDTTTKRRKYMTLDRIIRFRTTEGCRACRIETPHSRHTPICRARFNGLVRAEKIATSPASKVAEPKAPAFAPLTQPSRLMEKGIRPCQVCLMQKHIQHRFLQAS